MTMENKDKIEHLKYLLDKQNQWIQNSDTKASVILSFSGIILTIIFKNDFSNQIIDCIKKLFINNKILLVFLLILLCINLFFITSGFMFLFKTITPILKNKNNSKKSYIYFGSIAKSNINDLRRYFNKDFNPYNDLINQVYINSVIAQNKMNNFNKAIKYIGVSVPALIFLSIFIQNI